MANRHYDHQKIEEKWRDVWEEAKLFWETQEGNNGLDRYPANSDDLDSSDPSGENRKRLTAREKIYLLFAFAYPSGSGLHVGHVESKTALDILARYYRMNDKEVFFPVGWDAFGLPAENYAVKTGVHPAETTVKAINTFRRQIKRLGISYDWGNEMATSHPGYYKWTQWLFLKLYEKGLAYKKPGMVNWCPSCQTVLANEQVVQAQKQQARNMESEANANDQEEGSVGVCERCDTAVVQKEMEQWYFRITDYAEELISGLEQVDWPEATVQQQLNWIGKKSGINIHYPLVDAEGKQLVSSCGDCGDKSLDGECECEGKPLEVVCFTTRPDTNFGATFVVLGPEHELVEEILRRTEDGELKAEIEQYVTKAINKKEIERVAEGRKKTGVFTGFYAQQRLTGEKLPVYVSDFVLGNVGTGAVVGVPAHDKRDFDFSVVFNLPVKQVVKPTNAPRWRSYLMGGGEIGEADLEAIGVEIRGVDGDDRKLEIPAEKVEAYKELVREKLEPGFWNEVVGDEIWFCFKHEDGTISEYIYSEEKKAEIGRLCAEFSGVEEELTGNLYAFLGKNDWYRDWLIFEDEGKMVNSDFLDGMETEEAKEKMMDYLEEQGLGERVVSYKLRDWLISRQRYWGAPIPIVYDPEGKPHPVKEEHLPWMLPDDVDYRPKGTAPLGSSKILFDRVEKLYGKGWTPEIDTMDTFVDSSWYFLRYMSVGRQISNLKSQNQNLKLEGEKARDLGWDRDWSVDEVIPFDMDLNKQWLPVDFYMIGPEHIVLHLLYARFFTKFLRDEGYLCEARSPKSEVRNHNLEIKADGIDPDDHELHRKLGWFCVSEPFAKMRHQGMILGPDHKKMSKSKGNVINPDEIVEEYGADTLRIYEMFMGPIEADKPWDPSAVAGVYRFLNKIWRLVNESVEADKPTDERLEKKLHQTLRKVSEDIPALKFNTAIAAMMELVNEWSGKTMSLDDTRLVVRMLAPFAPFMAEELWALIDGRTDLSEKTVIERQSVHVQAWPKWDEEKSAEELVAVVVQVNGKKRGEIEVAGQVIEEIGEQKLLEMAREKENITKWITAEPKKVIWVKPKAGRSGVLSLVV